MIIGEELHAWSSVSESRSLENSEQFFKRYSIDRVAVEKLLVGVCNVSCRLFFVSTIPSGLGGSRSDLDVILVPTVEDAAPDISSMLFSGDRRVGAKIVTESAFEKTVKALNVLNNRITVSAYPASAPVKWADTERLVNGISFKDGAHYLNNLEYIATYSAQKALSTHRIQRLCCVFANRAGQVTTGKAYEQGAILALMDCLMAACGRVVANSKWIGERWRQFALLSENSNAGRCRTLINAMRDSQHTAAKSFGDWFASADVVAELITGEATLLHNFCLQLTPAAKCAEFLPGASCIKGKERAAVVAQRVLDLLSRELSEAQWREVAPADAAALLQLLQRNLLELKDVMRCH